MTAVQDRRVVVEDRTPTRTIKLPLSLASLRDSGVLSDDEFKLAEGRLLGTLIATVVTRCRVDLTATPGGLCDGRGTADRADPGACQGAQPVGSGAASVHHAGHLPPRLVVSHQPRVA